MKRLLALVTALALPLLPATADAAPGDNRVGFGYLGGTRLPTSDVTGLASASDGATYVWSYEDDAARRLLPSGLPDRSFGQDGFIGLSRLVGGQFVTATAAGPDLLLGSRLTSATGRERAFVRRLRPTGQLDPTFGTDGAAEVPLRGGPAVDSIVKVATDAQGRILVTSRFQVVRLRSDGTLDPTFGTGGVTLLPSTAEARRLVVDPAGEATVLIQAPGGALLVHLDAGGAIDQAWGSGGVAHVDRPGFAFGALAVGPDGSIVLGGWRGESYTLRGALARLTPTGQLDATFGFGGYAAPLVRCSGEEISDLAVAGDGRITAVGTTGSVRAFVARYATNGLLDPSFGNGGWRLAGTERAVVPAGGRSIYVNVALDIQAGTGDAIVARTGEPATVRAYELGGTRPTPARPPNDSGYWIGSRDGTVRGTGALDECGVAPVTGVVGGARSPDPDGYWLVTGTGRVAAMGKAASFGSYTGHLNRPVLGMAATPRGDGYWLLAGDGGVFSFGAARFQGSTGGIRLNRPIVGMAATATGGGYWLVASDGGIFSFGDAAFHGSAGGRPLTAPVAGMAATPSGRGYWLVGTDGLVLPFGDAVSFGTAVGRGKAIVGITPTASGRGYWLLAGDGTVFAFGDAVPAGNGRAGAVVLLHE